MCGGPPIKTATYEYVGKKTVGEESCLSNLNERNMADATNLSRPEHLKFSCPFGSRDDLVVPLMLSYDELVWCRSASLLTSGMLV